MKRYRKKADRLWIGLLVGTFMFCAMIVVFFRQNGWTFKDFNNVINFLSTPLGQAGALQLTTLCLLPNAMLAFVFYRFELWDTHKGVMIIALLSFIPLVLLLF